MLIILLTNMVNASNHRKCVSLSNTICLIQPTFIDLKLLLFELIKLLLQYETKNVCSKQAEAAVHVL